MNVCWYVGHVTMSIRKKEKKKKVRNQSERRMKKKRSHERKKLKTTKEKTETRATGSSRKPERLSHFSLSLDNTCISRNEKPVSGQ